MKLDLPLHLRLPLDDAWAALTDAGALARALPGAAVVESDEASARGTLSVDLGWTSVAYRGAIRVEETDAAARSVSIRGLGQGEAGEGLAELTATVILREQDEGETTVADVDLGVSADGDVGGLMSEEPEALAQRLGAAFADMLSGGPAATAGDEPSEPDEAGGDGAAAREGQEDEPAAVAQDIPLPQRPSPMEEIAIAEAMQHGGDAGLDEPEGTVRHEEPMREQEPVAEDEPLNDAGQGFIYDAEPIAPDIPEPERLGADPSAPPEPDLVPLAAELPKAPRTGSIPPPGWSPPASAAGTGAKAKARAKGRPRIARSGGTEREDQGAGADVAPASPSGASASGGLAGLVAKVKGALKR